MNPDGLRLRDRCGDPATRFGFVMSRRIGDSLVSMVVVENLRRAGRSVVVWSDHLHALRRWFPGIDIRPMPASVDRVRIWREHDVLLHFRPADVCEETRGVLDTVLVLDDLPEHRGPLTDMVSVHVDVCRTVFGIEDATRDTGLRRPDPTDADPDPARIVIHPTAGDPSRAWIPDRFIEVARRLQDRGWRPEFVTHPSERDATSWIEDAGCRRFAASELDQLAARLATSAGFFGSDSGVAHLASCIGLPFVTLYVRRKVAIRWRPGWSEGETIRPVWPLVFKPLKERFWAHAIPVSAVMAACDRVFGPTPNAIRNRSRRSRE
jgi:heptosyltransferase-3